MTQLHAHGALGVVPGSQTVPQPDDVWSSSAPVGCDEQPDPAAVAADLAVQVAEIAQRLDALAASTAAVRAEVETVGEALVQVCGRRRPQPSVAQSHPAPVDAATVPADDAAVKAVRLATGWIQRTYHHPLRIALVMMEGWTAQLEEIVAGGYLELSDFSVDEVLSESECSFGRWLYSGKADVLDPVRATELRHLHHEHHRLSAQVLTEVRDGRIEEARRLMESEDGRAGIARRANDAVRSWLDALCEQPVQNVA